MEEVTTLSKTMGTFVLSGSRMNISSDGNLIGVMR
jgi:hypothetical protein